MLEQGKFYKNYKELCEAIGWKITDGNSKKKQLAELEKYCKYIKTGNKFYISEVYEQPPIILARKDREVSLLNLEIQYAILKLLFDNMVNCYDKPYVISKTSLLCLVGLLNRNGYDNVKLHRQEYVKNSGINGTIVYKALNDVYKYATIYLDRAINQLVKQRICMVTKDVCYLSINKEVLDNNGNVIAYNRIYREATHEEAKTILETERQCIDTMGYNPKAFAEVENILKEKLGIIYYHKSYRFVFSEKFIKQDLDTMIDKVNYLHTQIINGEFIDLMENKVDKESKTLYNEIKRLDKIVEELTWKYIEDNTTQNGDELKRHMQSLSFLNNLYNNDYQVNVKQVIYDIVKID